MPVYRDDASLLQGLKLSLGRLGLVELYFYDPYREVMNTLLVFLLIGVLATALSFSGVSMRQRSGVVRALCIRRVCKSICR